MTYTVEKIGGTSMTAFDAVINNIFLKPEPYNRVFVVSAYSGITDGLLECKRSGKPGVYQLVAKRDEAWQQALRELETKMLGINQDIFGKDQDTLAVADKFVHQRVQEAINCIENIMQTCQYGQFSMRHYLPQIREFLSSIGEAHSAHNTVLKLNTLDINAQFVDLSGWDEPESGNLDTVIKRAFDAIDASQVLPIVTGYAYCDEGLMKTYDRGYSEMTFSRIACLTDADEAIIHKEYHLSTADPRIVGPDKVRPMGKTNFDVADQLANLGMEAIHPNAASGLRKQGIQLRVKNTFEPEHPGTLISGDHHPDKDKIEIVAGKDKVFALHLFDQSVVGEIDTVSCELMEIIADAHVSLVGKEMNANSMTYYLSGSSDSLNQVLYRAEKRYPNSAITGKMVALISVIGACINTNTALSKGMLALMKQDISPIAAHSSMRNVNVQFVVEDEYYLAAICALHQEFIDKVYDETAKAA